MFKLSDTNLIVKSKFNNICSKHVLKQGSDKQSFNTSRLITKSVKPGFAYQY